MSDIFKEKPNITEGEWRIGNYRPYRQVVVDRDKSKDNDRHPGNRKICSVNDNGNQRANAKAISAVPNLIIELLEQYRMLRALETDGLPPSLQNGGYERHIEGIESALKKAGCKLT